LSLIKLIFERGELSAEEIASLTDRALFQVRSSLRELIEAGSSYKKKGGVL
jgi:predicted transcriptional regulator